MICSAFKKSKTISSFKRGTNLFFAKIPTFTYSKICVYHKWRRKDVGLNFKWVTLSESYMAENKRKEKTTPTITEITSQKQQQRRNNGWKTTISMINRPSSVGEDAWGHKHKHRHRHRHKRKHRHNGNDSRILYFAFVTARTERMKSFVWNVQVMWCVFVCWCVRVCIVVTHTPTLAHISLLQSVQLQNIHLFPANIIAISHFLLPFSWYDDDAHKHARPLPSKHLAGWFFPREFYTTEQYNPVCWASTRWWINY